VGDLTHELVRRLAAHRDGAPVVTLYLDVDGRRHVRPADYEAEFERLAKPFVDPGAPDVAKRLHKVRSHVKAGFDRSRVKGVAVFCGDGLWETVELPVPVRNQLVVNDAPQVTRLEAVLDGHERFGVLLADRQRARILVFELGRLVDKTELFDSLPRHEDDGGDMRKDDVHDHQAAAAQHHLRRAAAATFDAHQEQPFAHVVIGAPDEMAGELERALHSYLRERVAARLTLPLTARDDQVREAMEAIEADVERQRKAVLVDRLRAGNGAVTGLVDVLPALGQRRVATLLVSDGFTAPGWRCDGCEQLAARGPKCAACGEAMARVDDVVEEAIETALTHNCRVEVCDGNADLDVLGRIGALVRF
jgi:peptide chain release factor subunit 1